MANESSYSYNPTKGTSSFNIKKLNNNGITTFNQYISSLKNYELNASSPWSGLNTSSPWNGLNASSPWSGLANVSFNELKSVQELIDMGYTVPLTDQKKILNNLDKLVDALKTNNGVLTEEQLDSIFGATSKSKQENIYGFYNELTGNTFDSIDENGNVIKGNTNSKLGENGEVIKASTNSNLYDSGIDEYKQLVKDSLMTDYASKQAQDYRNAMYGSIANYENTTNATLATAEYEAYKQLGQSQLQLENEIAANRMHALKTGTTSAQLAAQEIASMFAAQSGASQVALQTMQNKAQSANTIAQQRASVESDLWNMLNGNNQTAANAYAQLGAAQASYNSYINQPWAQYLASMNAYNTMGKNDYINMVNPYNDGKNN